MPIGRARLPTSLRPCSVGWAPTQSIRVKVSTSNTETDAPGRKGSGCIGARARASLPLFECGGCSALALAAGRINAFKSIVKSETKELRQLAEERELAQESSALVLRQLAEVREQKAHKQLKQLESANARLEEGFEALHTETHLQFKKIEEGLTVLLAQAAAEAARREETNSQAQRRP